MSVRNVHDGSEMAESVFIDKHIVIFQMSMEDFEKYTKERAEELRYRTRSDSNQKAIDVALRGAGATVVSLGDVGKGCPDRLVGYRGETYLIETKNRDAATGSRAFKDNHKRTEAQITFHESWKGKPVLIVYSVEEALKAIGAASQ